MSNHTDPNMTQGTNAYVCQMLLVGSIAVTLNSLVLGISLTKKLRNRDYSLFVGHIAVIHIISNLGRCGLKVGIFVNLDAPASDWERVLCPAWIYMSRMLTSASLFAVLPILVQRWATLRSGDFGGRFFRPASLAAVWLTAFFAALPQVGLRHESRRGLGCVAAATEEPWRPVVNGLSGLVLISHFALVAVFSALAIRRLRKQVRASVTENKGRLREMELVAKVAASQAAVPLLLFLPLLTVSLVRSFVQLPMWPLRAALEMIFLAPIYDAAATLAILGPYRAALKRLLRRLLGRGHKVETQHAATSNPPLRHQHHPISTF